MVKDFSFVLMDEKATSFLLVTGNYDPQEVEFDLKIGGHPDYTLTGLSISSRQSGYVDILPIKGLLIGRYLSDELREAISEHIEKDFLKMKKTVKND